MVRFSIKRRRRLFYFFSKSGPSKPRWAQDHRAALWSKAVFVRIAGDWRNLTTWSSSFNLKKTLYFVFRSSFTEFTELLGVLWKTKSLSKNEKLWYQDAPKNVPFQKHEIFTLRLGLQGLENQRAPAEIQPLLFFDVLWTRCRIH